MFRRITGTIEKDKDYPDRNYTLDVYSRVRDGALYDNLTHGFHEEKADNGDYVKIMDRRPSARTNLCRIVVDDAVSLLFSEGHFPTPDCQDKEANEELAALIKATSLNEVMVEAATIGSIGSVAIHMRALMQKDKSHRLFFENYSTEYLTPTFKPEAPDELKLITEKYKVEGRELKERGYEIKDDDLGTMFWFSREWDEADEIWFLPWKVNPDPAKDETKPRTRDNDKSVAHGLGFVPWVWVKNLPGKLRLIAEDKNVRYSDCDGACTFAAAIDTMIECDYLLSQGGRGLKYSMDPLLLIKEPVAQEGPMVRSAAQALVLAGEHSDAKMLEIGGSAFSVVLEYVRGLRELALEGVHGNRSDPQKLSTATSGRAMELMNQALIWLADKMRISYGEGALRSLLVMACEANAKFPLTVNGKAFKAPPKGVDISLNWPRWYPPTYEDRKSMADTLSTHSAASHISRETAVKTIAPDYDIPDVPEEILKIEADIVAASEILINEQAQVKAMTTTPT